MRVLLVDDEQELREAVSRRLRSEGHAVDEARSLCEVEQQLAIHTYGVVVLDRMLPDGDSIQLLRKWRSEGLATPVLFLTAKDRVGDRVEGLREGADDYLVKPFAMSELLARIAAMARRQPIAIPTVIRIDDVEIDTGRREVRRAGVLIPLRPKEFELLELLASRQGRVVRRADIIHECWDENHDPNSNVEEVLVAALRRKLGKPSVIQTVRGAGYMLETNSD